MIRRLGSEVSHEHGGGDWERVLERWGTWRTMLNPGSTVHWGFPGSSAGKESACNEGDVGSIPGLE